jgi:GrpB-like predicted nucleotidyltransferase (UPF0157 family)
VPEEQLDAYLDSVLIGGRERRAVVIADYDAGWTRRFDAERERIEQALGGVALTIEHIGSTAVPGLAAKPIVDVLVTVADVGDETSYGPALERAGYELRVREPEHRMYRTPARDVHVHVWGDGDPEGDRYLVFRDRLRASPDDRSEYERLKRSLAQREWSDMNHYADAKGPVIEAILARARQSHISPARSTDAGAVAGLLGALGYPTDADAAATQLEPALAVRAERRRQGVARALLEAVEAIARGRACFRLELTTRPDRDDALRFYEACGFAERPRRLVKPL